MDEQTTLGKIKDILLGKTDDVVPSEATVPAVAVVTEPAKEPVAVETVSPVMATENQEIKELREQLAKQEAQLKQQETNLKLLAQRDVGETVTATTPKEEPLPKRSDFAALEKRYAKELAEHPSHQPIEFRWKNPNAWAA